MSDLDIRYEEDGWRVRVESDYDAESPDCLWESDESFIVSFHRHFTVTRKGLGSPEDIGDWEEDYLIIPLSAYIHSGVHLYTGTDKVCRWDSCQVGYVLVKKDIDYADASELAERIVGIWNTYLSGDVWRVVVEKLSCSGCGTWEEHDSLSCIYGEDGVDPEVERWAEHLASFNKGEACTT